MKRTISYIGLVSFLLIACAGNGTFLFPSPVQALQGITGIDALMGVPCATNWSRAAPHICAAANIPQYTDLSLNGTCQALDVNVAFGIPTSATYWVFAFRNISVNIFVTFYRDAACTQAVPQIEFFSPSEHNVYAPLLNGKMYYLSAANYDGGCGSIGCLYNPVLYYD